jgi:hypothetical protein
MKTSSKIVADDGGYDDENPRRKSKKSDVEVVIKKDEVLEYDKDEL